MPIEPNPYDRPDLLPQPQVPLFDNDRIDVTRKFADAMARLFQMLVRRGEKRESAQRFVLQSLVAMVAEDVGMLPTGIFYELTQECASKSASSYDLIGGLFAQMNRKEAARGDSFPFAQVMEWQTSPPQKRRPLVGVRVRLPS